MKIRITTLALLALSIAACKKDELPPKPPVISSLAVSPKTVTSGSLADTVLITFDVSDENGDLGFGSSSQDVDIYLKDSWGNNPFPFYFPEIPEGLSDNGKGISARCTVRVPASQYLFIRPDPIHAKGDTVKYEIYVVDRAKQESNKLTTPNIFIMP